MTDEWLGPRERIMLIVHRRLVGLLVRHGLLKHPWGRGYVLENYTVTGKHRPPDDEEGRR